MACNPVKPGTNLSPRETEVLTYICKGFTNPEIGRLLKLSPHTIADNVSAILARLDVSSRIEAAVWAAKKGLV